MLIATLSLGCFCQGMQAQVVSAYLPQQPEDKVGMALNSIRERYVDSIDIRPWVEQYLLQLGDSLDPHSEYTPASAFAPNGLTAMEQNAVLDAGNGILAAYMVNKQVGCIDLSMFTHTTVSAFQQSLADLRRQGMKHLVLNIQNNGGGYFESAVDLADEFLRSGCSIVHINGAHIPGETEVARREGTFEKGNLAVLINGQTMSAAEIFAGALQDWDRAILVGTRSFGKGLIQETMPYADGSAFRYSVAAYNTPCGRSIQRPFSGLTLRQYFSGPDPALEQPGGAYGTDAPSFRSLTVGRTLYGNGGIAPDVYVPADTLSQTDWLMMLQFTGVIRRVAGQYYASHSEDLLRQYPTFKAFARGFDAQQLLPVVVDVAEHQAGFGARPGDYERSAAYVALETKAYLARHLYGADDCYYQLMDSANPAMAEAVRIVSSQKLYRQYFK